VERVGAVQIANGRSREARLLTHGAGLRVAEYNQHSYIVTAAHVATGLLQPESEGWVHFFLDDRPHRINRVVVLDERRDLAILETTGAAAPQSPWAANGTLYLQKSYRTAFVVAPLWNPALSLEAGVTGANISSDDLALVRREALAATSKRHTRVDDEPLPPPLWVVSEGELSPRHRWSSAAAGYSPTSITGPGGMAYYGYQWNLFGVNGMSGSVLQSQLSGEGLGVFSGVKPVKPKRGGSRV
jgi:hypothetical protein